MNNDLTDFISAAVADKPVQAIKAFSSAMEPKIQAALDNRKIEVTKQIFNTTSVELEEPAEVEVQELEDDENV